jgi:benzoyl-CoA reductase subunit C
MVNVASQGLSKAEEIYQDRSRRAKELKAAGKKVIGYLCLHPPLELITAAGLVPYRILGDIKEPITKADTYLPTVVCPFLRSCLELGLKGRYNFLDGLVSSHSCDVGARLAGWWNAYVQTPWSHYLFLPHTTREWEQERFKGGVEDYKEALENLTGQKLTPARIKKAVREHNRQRALVRDLYELRKPDPPLITGAETLKVVVALMSLPVEEGNQLLEEVTREVKERPDRLPKKAARILVWGPVFDNTAIIDLIESLEAYVVMDDTCVGSRAYFDDVKATADPIKGLADHYLLDLKCPRTFREKDYGETKKDYPADLKFRFDYLGQYIKDWKVNGVVLLAPLYCDAHAYELPGWKDYLSNIGIPSIYLEHDYSQAALGQLRTRVQAFLEMIGP